MGGNAVHGRRLNNAISGPLLRKRVPRSVPFAFLFGCSALLLGCSAVPGAVPSASGWIRDSSGRVVILHGVNVVWKTPPYVPPTGPGGITDADAVLMRSLGFNAVRLGFVWEGFEPRRGVFDETYLNQLVAVERLFARHGMQVVIDSHQDELSSRFHGEGFPEWAVYTDGLPDCTPASFSVVGDQRVCSPAMARAWDNLWANRAGLWQAYSAMWKKVAARFASEPGVLGYDILNEPWAGTQWETCITVSGCPGFYRQYLQPFENMIAASIRSVDRVHKVIFEPDDLASSGTHIASSGPQSWLTSPTPAGPNTLYTFHLRCSFDSSTSSSISSAATNTLWCNNAMKANLSSAARLQAPVLIGEDQGCYGNSETALAVHTADAARVGWIHWAWKSTHQDNTGGIDSCDSMFQNDADFATLDQTKADILSEPYPTAISGTPSAYGFDPSTNTFELTYTPDPSIKAPTVVFSAPRHYPTGYRIEVRGAHVTSRPCAPYVTTVNDPGSARVSLRLIPGSCRSS
jgi:endoglycosylceramidase